MEINKQKQSITFFKHIFTGSLAIGVAKSVLAPLERVKLIIQTNS